MWGAVLLLIAVFVAGMVVEAGAVLWVAVLAGLAVFGGDPSDPVSAVLVATHALLTVGLLRSAWRSR